MSRCASSCVVKVSVLFFNHHLPTLQCTIDKENVMGVIRGSRRFHLHFVARKCASFLDQYVTSSQSFFTIDNVLVTYKAAGEYGFPKLKEECKKFAATRFWELIETQCFKDLSFLVRFILLYAMSLLMSQYRTRLGITSKSKTN